MIRSFVFIPLGLALVVLATFIPLRVSSLSEQELLNGSNKKNTIVSKSFDQERALTLVETFFGFDPALKPLLKPSKVKKFNSAFPHLEKEIETWINWQKGRRGRALFPVDDPRGLPTLALLKLSTLLYAERSYSGSFSAELLELRDTAPAKQWGKVEDALMGLLTLSSKYNIRELSLLMQSIDSVDTLMSCAGLFQRIPSEKDVFLKLHSETPLSLLPKLYERISLRGMSEWEDAIGLMSTDPKIYLYWLSDGRSIRKGWQREWWQFGSQFLPTSFFSSLGKVGLVFFFLILITGVVLVIWHWIPAERGRYGLRIGSSLLLCLLLGISLEWMPSGVGQDLSLKLSGPTAKETTSLDIPLPETENDMKELPIESIQLMLVFLGIQVLIFIWSCIQINKISKHEGDSTLKIKLLDNEDMLFDMGLYIGLGGTVLSLILMVMGQENQGLIAAYTSTMFGIIEVAIFKIFILRPYKQKLIIGT